MKRRIFLTSIFMIVTLFCLHASDVDDITKWDTNGHTITSGGNYREKAFSPYFNTGKGAFGIPMDSPAYGRHVVNAGKITEYDYASVAADPANKTNGYGEYRIVGSVGFKNFPNPRVIAAGKEQDPGASGDSWQDAALRAITSSYSTQDISLEVRVDAPDGFTFKRLGNSNVTRPYKLMVMAWWKSGTLNRLSGELEQGYSNGGFVPTSMKTRHADFEKKYFAPVLIDAKNDYARFDYPNDRPVLNATDSPILIKGKNYEAVPGTGLEMGFDIILVLPGLDEDSTDGSLVTKEDTVTIDGMSYVLSEGEDYSSVVNVKATLTVAGRVLKEDVISIPLNGFYKRGEPKTDAACSLNINTTEACANLDLQHSQMQWIKIADMDFLSQLTFEGTKEPSVMLLFLSSDPDPFAPSPERFVMVHDRKPAGIALNARNSMNYDIIVAGQGEGQSLFYFDGTSHIGPTEDPQGRTDMIKARKSEVAGANFREFHGQVYLQMERKGNGLMAKGRYTDKIYVHVISMEYPNKGN